MFEGMPCRKILILWKTGKSSLGRGTKIYRQEVSARSWPTKLSQIRRFNLKPKTHLLHFNPGRILASISGYHPLQWWPVSVRNCYSNPLPYPHPVPTLYTLPWTFCRRICHLPLVRFCELPRLGTKSGQLIRMAIGQYTTSADNSGWYVVQPQRTAPEYVIYSSVSHEFGVQILPLQFLAI
jgi:hypothetical protein